MTAPAWLHGWPLVGTSVHVGSSTFCAGCGRPAGLITIAVDEEWIEWAKDRPMPEWPFPEDQCPVHGLGGPPTERMKQAERIVRALAAPGDVKALAEVRRWAREWVRRELRV